MIDEMTPATFQGFALSPQQVRLWHLAAEGLPGAAGAIRITGDLDPVRLRAAVAAVVARHEILRTGFQLLPGMTVPVQGIAEPEERPPVWEDFDPGQEGTADLLDRFLAAGHRAQDVPLRLALVPEHRLLLLALHPLCGDARTLAVLTTEIARAYAEGEPDGDPMQYADYAAWQNDVQGSEAARADAAHWSRQDDLAELLALALPFERRGDLPFLPARLRLAIEAPADATEPWLLAAWQAWLARLTGQTQLAVAGESAGRDFEELTGACGPFARALPVAAEVDEDRPLSDLAAATARALAEAREHQDGFTWPEGSFPAWSFAWEPAPVMAEGFTLEDRTAWSDRSTLSLTCRHRAGGPGPAWPEQATGSDEGAHTKERRRARPAQAGGQTLDLEIRFDAARLDRGEAERILHGFAALIRNAAAAAPDAPLGELEALSDDEREQTLAAPNRTRRDLAGADRCLHELVAAQAARTPDAIALRWEGGTLTFAELESRAALLARRLLVHGIHPEARVAVLVERSPEMVIALLGVLKAGAAWVPLDPDHPEGRLTAILEDAAPAVAVTRSTLSHRLPAELPRVLVDAPEAEEPPPLPLPAADPDQLAYVIHTSGSTGRPKGVQVTHRAILNRLLWMNEGFSLAPDDRVLQKTPYGFDASIWEIFCPLLAGAEVVLARPGGHQDVGYLAAAVARQGITVLQLVPSLLGPFLDEPAAAEIRSLRRMFCGGEALTPELVRRFFARFDADRCSLCNLYGPTEAAIDAAFRVCAPEMERVPIGRALPNVRLFVVNRRLRPVPLGAPGELLIGGTNLARGYLGRPDWTAERFVPDPWSGEPGARLYRTGDLVRRLPGGELEYLGRIDRQVKIRGVRIELREIEALLAAHPGVSQAVVVARGRGGEARLLAYAVPTAEAAGGLAPASLREHLAGRLPAAMVPAAFAVLHELPRTPNGKLDENALPEPGTASAAADGGAPETPVEQLLAGIWAEVLGRAQVGVRESFFDLGGHSLSATQVVSRVRKAFGIDLRVQTLFDEPTLAGLAREVERAIRAGSGTAAPPIEPVPRDRPLPLSFAQQRLWFLQRLYPESSFYNLPLALGFRGDLHIPALERSLAEIVRRHESLRTVFREGQDGEPVQVIGPPFPVALPRIDLAGLPAEAAEAELARLVAREVARPFDLSSGPLLRALLLRKGERDHVGLLNLHHIVTDAWSTAVLTREISALYPACLRGEPAPLPEPPLQYADFAAWQRGWLRGEILDSRIAWWHEHLRGAPAALELPGDRPRPEVQTFRGATTSRTLAAGLGEDLAAFSRRHGVTLFMTLLAASQVLLRWWTGQSDLVVGTDVASRSRGETEGLVGFFINQLALRTDLSGDPPFTGLLEQVRATTLGAYAHDDLPFDRLVASLNPERSRGQSPVFQVKVSLHNVPAPPLEMPGLAVELLQIPRETTQSDLILNFRHDPPSLLALADYSTDLFDEATILRLLGRLEALLAHVLEHPEARVGELCEALSGTDWRRFNETATILPGDGLLHTAVEAQAARTPDRIAVRCGEAALTWAELMRWSGQLAGALRRLGVGPDVPVAVCAERSPEMVVALLGILRAGGAYVPLDPDHPVERLRMILGEVRPRVLVARGALPPGLDPGTAAVVRLDQPLPDSAGEPGAAPDPDNLAYILYTSGSTGRPKGVQVPHRAIANRVLWMQQAFPLAADDRVLQKTPYGFDASIWEIFLPLAVGAELVLARPGGHQDAAYLVRAVQEEGITVLQLVPTLLRAFLDEPGVERCALLRRVFCGGEELPTDLAERLSALLPAELGNLYGPTETAIDATAWACRDGIGRRSVPIGRPIANLQVFLLDRDGRPVPFGTPGELLVGGMGLARGYFGRPDLTAERFVPHPYGGPGERLYRTGDLARHLSGGELEYLGRVDRQIKLRGVRIEPGEIEAALRTHPGVREAVVTARPVGAGGGLRLVAHLVPRDSRLPIAGLRDFLAERLPLSMVPSLFVILPELPRNANGKVDLNALPEPTGVDEAAGDAPRSESEELLAALWAELLGQERVGVHDDFFALGGHSLLATRVVSRIRQRLGVDLPLHTLFDAPTVAGLARELDAALRGGAAGALPPIERVPRTGELPLSFAQQRLWFYERRRPGTAVFNILVTFRLRGVLRPGLLARAFTEVVRRHEILRTTFPEQSGLPVQQVGEPWDVPLPLVDLAALPPALREAETARLVLAEGDRPFDLAAGPLLRLLLLRHGPEEHVLPFSVHHIVSDAWSSGLLTRELAALYRAYAAGAPSPLPELTLQYADFAAWQQRQLAAGTLAPQIDWWKKRLAGAPPLLDLPADRPRPEMPSYRGLTRPVTLPADLSEKLRSLGLREGATPFMILLAALQVLLRRMTGRDDLVVGTDVAGRNRVEIEGLLGFFVNQLALRTDLSGDPTFSELLARVREVTLAAYAHQDAPFEHVVDALKLPRTLSHAPVFQVKLFVDNSPPGDFHLPGLTFEPLDLETEVAKLDLTLAFWQRGGVFQGWINYNTDLFDSPRIERMLGHYRTLLEAIADRPGARLSELDRVLGEVARKEHEMEKRDLREMSFKKFKAVAPRTVVLPQEEVVEKTFLAPGQELPLVVRPLVPDVDLADWAAAHRESLEADLLRYGAILFRGFGLDTPETFERFAGTLCPDLFNENGEHPRESVSGNVYTPVFYPQDQQLLWHNENSFNWGWPRKIFFACARPADAGGETPIVDSRRVYREIPAEIRDRFERLGVSYQRNYSEALGLHWKTVFQVDDRAAVEAECREDRFELEWRDGDRLRTRALRPGVVRHPVTGEPSWFNQAQHWHVSCLDSETSRAMRALFPDEGDLPRHCTYGDGSPIADAEMDAIRDVYRRLEVSFPWQRGDVLMLDNVLTAHGRNPFQGQRKILVALGQMTTYSDLGEA